MISIPPFLNRFKKQFVDFTTILMPLHRSTLAKLQEWVSNICKLPMKYDGLFTERDTFAGICDGTLASLVFVVGQISEGQHYKEDYVLDKFKRRLLRIASCQGVECALISGESPEVTTQLCSSYFQDKSHISLKNFISSKTIQQYSKCGDVSKIILTK